MNAAVKARGPAALLRTLAPLSIVFAFACGDDDPYGDLGGYCRDDRDCLRGASCEHRAQGGQCLWLCRDDRECPVGWACVDSHKGTCHPLCVTDRDCPFPYECKGKKNRTGGGDGSVCEP